jgi:hypothetical protein
MVVLAGCGDFGSSVLAATKNDPKGKHVQRANRLIDVVRDMVCSTNTKR